MYEVIVEKSFEAAHFLRGYQGKCENVHGHRYTVRVRLQSSSLNEIGLAYDFTDIKRYLAEAIARFDHALLNEIPPFDRTNPSAENIARTLYLELQSRLSGEAAAIAAVEVWENPQQGIAFTPD